MSGEILCDDCLDTGWQYDREGRSVCGCISETEPYQILQSELDQLKAENERLQAEMELVRTQQLCMDAITKDAERWRDLPRAVHALWDSCIQHRGTAVVSLRLLESLYKDKGGE